MFTLHELYMCVHARAHVLVPYSGNTLWPLHKLYIGCQMRVLCEHGDNTAWLRDAAG